MPAISESRQFDQRTYETGNIHLSSYPVIPLTESYDVTNQQGRRFATYEDYQPKVVKSVAVRNIERHHQIKRLYTFTLEPFGKLAILLPVQSEVFPLPSTSLSELNGAATYLKSKSKGPYIKGNPDHSHAADALEKYWPDIGPCFYEDGTVFPENAMDSLSGVVFENLGVLPTESDVLGFGPDNRIFNLELKKTKGSRSGQIKRQESGIGAVLAKENDIEMEPERVVSVIGVYSVDQKKNRAAIDCTVSRGGTIYKHYTGKDEANSN